MGPPIADLDREGELEVSLEPRFMATEKVNSLEEGKGSFLFIGEHGYAPRIS